MSEPALPAWARDDAFPIHPDTSKFGVVDHSRISRSFESLDELKAHLEVGKGRLDWVWTPKSDRLVAPEEIPKLAGSLKHVNAMVEVVVQAGRTDFNRLKRRLTHYTAIAEKQRTGI